MKSRFCPSPTGLMHIGNARTALFSYLLAIKQSGQFLLRIEDTDQTRSHEKHTEQLMDDLRWLGIQWHEGPEAEGDHTPYFQSQRGDVYANYYAQLEEAGKAYPCFCSDEQLALNRKVQRGSGLPPRYPGTCRHLSADDVAEKINKGEKPTLRFLVANDELVEFEDGVRGSQRFTGEDIGDFIIRRADGTSSFMFCNAVDDSLMGVTHVVRGEDHLTNTPRQLMILNGLSLPAPSYAHISLILGQDGAPLSKRNGSRSIKDLRDEGYLPNAVVNYFARLGHYYADNDFMTAEELASRFAMENLNKSPARIDYEHLRHWQKEAVMGADDDVLWEWFPDDVSTLIADEQRPEFIELIRGNIIYPQDAMLWAEALFAEHLDFSHDNKEILTAAGLGFFECALQIIEECGADYKAIVDGLKKELEVKGKALFQPLRIAITAQSHGPEMARIIPLMGVARLRQRFEDALFHI